MEWRLDQEISDDTLFQLNYHLRDITPDQYTYDSVEDVVFNPRISFRLAPELVLLGEYLYGKIQYNDLGRSPLNDRGAIPPDLNYADLYNNNASTICLMFKVAPSICLKPSFSLTRSVSDGFNSINTNGWLVSMGSDVRPFNNKGPQISFSAGSGYQSAVIPQFSFDRTMFDARIKQCIGSNSSIGIQYSGEYRNYINLPGAPKAD